MRISFDVYNIGVSRNIKTNISFSSKELLNLTSNLSQDTFENTMTEKEKMLAGFSYFAGDDELCKDKKVAQDLWFRYNKSHPSDEVNRKQIMKELLGKTGEEFFIEPDFKCDYGYNIEIGERFFSNYNLVILDTAKIKFGDDVLIGPNCSFYAASHPINPVERKKGTLVGRPINVGNNVWIGGSVAVLGGVNIGDNVVVAAGSVVTKDLPANTICAGCPCRPIKDIDKTM